MVLVSMEYAECSMRWELVEYDEYPSYLVHHLFLYNFVQNAVPSVILLMRVEVRNKVVKD